MDIKSIMNRDIKLVSGKTTVKEAAEKMEKSGVGFLPVGENDVVEGTLTDRDIVLNAIAKGKDPAQTQIHDIMHPTVRACHEDKDVEEVARMMNEERVRRMPIIDGENRLVGVVSIGDMAQHLRPETAGEVLRGVTV